MTLISARKKIQRSRKRSKRVAGNFGMILKVLSIWDGACSRRTVAVYQEEGGGEREENIELFTILIHGREKFPCLWALGGGGG